MMSLLPVLNVAISLLAFFAALVLQQIIALYFYTHHEFGSNFVVIVDLVIGNMFHDQMYS